MRKLDTVEPTLKEILWAILEEIETHREASVTRSDFTELKAIVADLAKAQDRTEQRMDELTQIQQRTEQRMNELAEAQGRTEVRMAETQQAIAALAHSSERMHSAIGGLGRSVSYALENEAYRQLPAHLAQQGIHVEERFIRTTIEGEEVDFLAHARRGEEPVLIVGEAVVRLDDRAKFEQLERHVEIAEAEYNLPVVPLLVTHYATPDLLRAAQRRGVIVVQSFEWA